MPGADTPLQVAERVHCARVGNQTVVADLRSGCYLGLDEVATAVWALVEDHATRGAIVDRVHAEYDVPRDVLERDVDRLLEDLLRRRLVEYVAAGGEAGRGRVASGRGR